MKTTLLNYVMPQAKEVSVRIPVEVCQTSPYGIESLDHDSGYGNDDFD